ncbi:hypothetical protein COO60DRAFT_1487756 [Scenedesmus sp. NREL 46B-D3]|nr:hypothetical protein COO60DRAFT_1487756 [Scenedesmus sp. NREL 46B-D3]
MLQARAHFQAVHSARTGHAACLTKLLLLLLLLCKYCHATVNALKTRFKAPNATGKACKSSNMPSLFKAGVACMTPPCLRCDQVPPYHKNRMGQTVTEKGGPPHHIHSFWYTCCNSALCSTHHHTSSQPGLFTSTRSCNTSCMCLGVPACQPHPGAHVHPHTSTHMQTQNSHASSTHPCKCRDAVVASSSPTHHKSRPSTIAHNGTVQGSQAGTSGLCCYSSLK